MSVPTPAFIARQPILDRAGKLFAYELLYRDETENHSSVTPEKAIRTTLDNSVLFGLESLCFDRPAFFSCTRDVLVEGLVTLLPSKSTIVEVLGSVVPDRSVIKACEELKNAGFRIALDDFIPGSPLEPLLPLADFVKCDFPQLPVRDRSELPNRLAQRKIAALAEKVETQQDFKMASDCGYALFQGYFFCHPSVLTTRALPLTVVSYLRLLDVLCSSDIDLNKVVSIVQTDPVLSYRLLRLLNSYKFGLTTEVTSIRHALVLLGGREFRKWAIVTTFCQAATSKPDQLMVTALCRARACELIAPALDCSAEEFFLTGVASLLHAILDMPRAQLLQQLPLAPSIKEALANAGGALGDVLKLVVAYEQGSFENCEQLKTKLNLQNLDIGSIYFDSVQWAEHASGRQEQLAAKAQ